jgi:hypothetical protein
MTAHLPLQWRLCSIVCRMPALQRKMSCHQLLHTYLLQAHAPPSGPVGQVKAYLVRRRPPEYQGRSQRGGCCCPVAGQDEQRCEEEDATDMARTSAAAALVGQEVGAGL